MKGKLLSSDIFILGNRRKIKCKLLRWHDDGFEIYPKRIVKEYFEIPENGEIKAYILQLILSGVVADRIRKKQDLV